MPRSLPAFVLVGSLFWTVVACGSSEPVATTQDPSQSSASAAREDVIRGKGGLEEKCHEAVAEKGTKVVGTNRVEESEAAIEIGALEAISPLVTRPPSGRSGGAASRSPRS